MKQKLTFLNHFNPLAFILFSSVFLALLGTIASIDFISSFSSWKISFVPESTLIRQILSVILGVFIAGIAVRYVYFYHQYSIYFFLAGIFLMLLSMFQPSPWVPLFTNYITLHSGYWSILFSMPLMATILNIRQLNIRIFLISFIIPFVVMNLFLYLSQGFDLLVLFNLLAMIICVRSSLKRWQKLSFVVLFIVLSLFLIAQLKQDYIQQQWQQTVNKLSHLSGHDDYTAASCIGDLSESGIIGNGLGSFEKPVDSHMYPSLRGFLWHEVTPRQFPLKIICRQIGWFGFVLSIILYYVLIHSSWFFVNGIQKSENWHLALMLFYLLFIPVVLQLLKNILPLAMFPSYELYFMGWGPHNGMFPLVVSGLIYGLAKQANKS